MRAAYGIGYLLGPLLCGYWVLTRAGFKATFITGLGILTIACLAFWPSAVLLSYPGFVVSTILVGAGLSILANAGNAFIALAGPENLMESRLNFSQGLEAVGSVIAPLLALNVIFKDFSNFLFLNGQWVFLAISLWSSFLGVVFYYVPLSEAGDEDLERVALQREVTRGLRTEWKVFKINIIWYISVTGIFFMFLYVGAQEHVWQIWDYLIQVFKPSWVCPFFQALHSKSNVWSNSA